MDIDSLPDNSRAVVVEELEPGETIAWLDRPGRRAFRGLKIGIFLFGLLWMILSLSFLAMTIEFHRNAPELGESTGMLMLIGIPCILLSVAFMSIPSWIGWMVRSVAYVITDRRVLIVGRNWAWRITTIPPERIGTLSRTQRDDGSGTITFGPPTGSSEGAAPVAFCEVADAKHVETLLRELAATANE